MNMTCCKERKDRDSKMYEEGKRGRRRPKKRWWM